MRAERATKAAPAVLLGALCALLAGCEQGPPPTAAQQADLAACTRNADAAYQNATVADLSRSAVPNQKFSGLPEAIYQYNDLSAEHVRESQITNCMNNGAGNPIRGLHSGPLPTPRIITPADQPSSPSTGVAP